MNYNSLHVPLNIGTWQCMLVLAREYYSLGGGFWDPFSNADERKKQERQIEEDRRTFDLYFRPNYDFRRLIASDIDAILSFLSQHLNVAHWDLPTDNAGIERSLKQAVEDEKLVPIVNRDWRCFPMTYRPTPAPLRWPPTVNSPVVHATPYVGGLSATIASQPALAGEEAISGSASDGSSGFDWLGDAQPFTYAEDASTADVEQSAGMFLTPVEEAECEAQLNADMDECSAWYAAKPSSWGVCRERAMQRYANCLRGFG
ncbi:hypothetical protein FAZ69_20235 [Trinickia terrae]|uniref:Uncharacterized protein n=1 Tax=Trinickia terrae TaxID=2571161 RepID=A0A4U1I1D2_9BURK|nr:hypothetical protein [Trinickia terrae]TKC86952.1 hypothetical protein FAZ69_20235 [Trinickia terrae]